MASEIDEVQKKKKGPNYYEQYAADLHEKAMQKMREAELAKLRAAQPEQQAVQQVQDRPKDLGTRLTVQDSLVSSHAVTSTPGSKSAPAGSTKETTPTRQDAPIPANAVAFPIVTPRQVTDPGQADTQQGGEGTDASATARQVDENAVLDAREAVKHFKNTAARVREQAQKAIEVKDHAKATELLDHAAHLLEQGAEAARKLGDPATSAALYEEAAEVMKQTAKQVRLAAQAA